MALHVHVHPLRWMAKWKRAPHFGGYRSLGNKITVRIIGGTQTRDSGSRVLVFNHSWPPAVCAYWKHNIMYMYVCAWQALN